MTKDFTQGKITPQLIGFTIPLVLGNLFQLTYNAVDSIIVGQFVGKEALAAVGTSNPLTTLIILFLNGLCMGASILMGTQYGAKDEDTLKRQISTTFLSGIAFSTIVMILCILLARPILMLIQVDASILSMSTEYLRIIFCGLVFTFLYNFYASTLRALGDSSTPLYFLIISSVLNVIGDLFFVVTLHWGSNGAAISTVISEAL
ncbi:MAG: MATE family efflux transporter, partial [Lachnospira sp.]|nr:MATE family efflux transporter [Lachnospira sp.]